MSAFAYANSRHKKAAKETMFPTDRNVNLNGRVLFCFEFRQECKKEMEFQKCSFKLLNVVLIKESNFMAVLSL